MSRTSLDQLPAGTSVSESAKTFASQLSDSLKTGWPATYPPYVPANEDTGIVQPWSANVAGTAPQCVVDQIALNFGNWGVPSDQNTVTAMAKEITEEISAHGGAKGTFYGQTPIAGSETVYWGVAYGTVQVVAATDGNPAITGIVYAFTGQVNFS